MRTGESMGPCGIGKPDSACYSVSGRLGLFVFS
jgi:hypothetical protein